jgi:hypothetical protein
MAAKFSAKRWSITSSPSETRAKANTTPAAFTRFQSMAPW